MNSASLQLIPASVCAVRAAAGAARPFDILPAVWLTSLCSLLAGLGAERLLRRKP
jgi:spore maturation protein A